MDKSGSNMPATPTNDRHYWWGFLTNDGNKYFRDAYGSPPDPFGIGAVGLDLAGRPMFTGSPRGRATILGYGAARRHRRHTSMPYELNLAANVRRGLPAAIPRQTIRSAWPSWSGSCGPSTATATSRPIGWPTSSAESVDRSAASPT